MPSVILEGSDVDSDKLTDIEEAVYGSDAKKLDTDADGYPDGSEVSNLYNPVVKGSSLSGAQSIKPETWDKLSLLIPKAWTLTVDAAAKTARLTIPGVTTQFMFDLKLNPSRESLAVWLGKNLGDATSLRAFKTKGGFEAMQTPDGLKTYLAAGDTVLLITYAVNSDTAYEYRTSYAMVLNSLQLGK